MVAVRGGQQASDNWPDVPVSVTQPLRGVMKLATNVPRSQPGEHPSRHFARRWYRDGYAELASLKPRKWLQASISGREVAALFILISIHPVKVAPH